MERRVAVLVGVVVILAAVLYAYHVYVGSRSAPSHVSARSESRGVVGGGHVVSNVVVVDVVGRRVGPVNASRLALVGDPSLLVLVDMVSPNALERVVAFNASGLRGVAPRLYAAYLESHPSLATAVDVAEGVERLQGSRPTLIILDVSTYHAHPSLVEELERVAPVIVVDPDPLHAEAYERSVELLSRVLGGSAEAARLAGLVGVVKERLADITLRPRVLSLGVPAEMIEAAGGVENSEPDVVVAVGLSPVDALSKAGSSPAARHYHACSIPRELLLGPLRAVGLLAVAKAIHPAVFRDVDLEAVARNATRLLSAKLVLKPLEYTEPPRKRVLIVDALGRKVWVEAPAKRIVVMYGLEDLVAVSGEYGLAHLVAFNRFRYVKWRPDWWYAWRTHFPWLEKLPDTAQPGYGFSVEKLIALKPDVVIVAAFMYKKMLESGDIQRLEKAGIPVVVIDFVPPTTNLTQHLETVKRSIMALGAVTGYVDRAEKLYEFYEEQVLGVVKRVENASVKPRVLVLATWAPWRAYGRGGMYQVWITLAGGENIAASVIPGSSGDINPEYVLKANPDVIIFTCNNNVYTPEGRRQVLVIGYNVNSTQPAKRLLEELVKRPGWEKLNAVRNGRVYLIHHGLSHGHIFQFAALQWIAKWLHPGLFKSLDPQRNLAEFYAKFMPFPLRGVWAVGMRDP